MAEVLAETQHVVIEGNGSKKTHNNANLEIMGNSGDSQTGHFISMLKCDYEFGNTNVLHSYLPSSFTTIGENR